VCAFGLIIGGARVGETVSQPEQTSSSRGAFTDEQATRGEETYMGVCVSCHPRGTYATAAFRTTWNGHPLSELYDFVKDKMPKNDPGSLTPRENIQVIAYLLKINGVESGNAELPPDSDTLKKIRIDMPAGELLSPRPEY
jgi:S-disulfanyl-L-cysteine oxidoreductase SoxD